MAPHSSTLAWKIPWMEEPGGLQSMGSLGVGHDWATSLSLFTLMLWRRKCQPTPVFLPGESQGWGAWWAAVYGVAQSRTRLKRLSRSSSSSGGNGIPMSYFKSWKMMLWKCCTQYASKFGKLSSGHRTGKGQFSFQSQRKAMPKNAQTMAQLHSFHMLVK